MKKNSIGLIELSSIAAGFLVTDTMLKTADVELLINRTICSGKYLILVGGDVAAVNASVETGVAIGGASIIDSCLIPNIVGVTPRPELKDFVDILERRYTTTKWIFSFDLRFSDILERMLSLYLTDGGMIRKLVGEAFERMRA